jgi:predicted ATPase
MTTARQAGFGDLLRRFRLSANLSQETLAERSGLSVRGISDLERGERRAPRPETVDLLASALGLSAAERALLSDALQRAREPGQAAVSSRPLPAPLTRLLGREREEASVIHLLHRERVRLVTLTGPGGVGKTRLALQVAWTLSAELPDGAVFVDLAPLHDPALVSATIATALGLRDSGGRPLRERLVGALRERELLLVLDNLEQVLAAAPLASELLAACPRLTILATSRGPLQLRGEHELPVLPLAVPDSDVHSIAAQAPEELRQYAAVELFLQRAQAATPSFRITPGNAAAVAEICRRLEGLPLAIELAAARIRVLTPATLLAQLDRRLAVLTGGPQDAPTRQRTLRDAIAWGYELLDEPAKSLFRRLSVFTGGCTLEALQAVGVDAPAPGSGSPAFVLDQLTALVHQQLLRTEERPDGDQRFTMLESIREYALEQAEASGESDAARQRHALYFRDLAERAEPHLHGPEQATWLDRLAREADNLRAALAWAVDAGDAETGLRLAGALARYWWLAGHLSEGRRHLERLLAMPEAATPTATRASALQALGMLLARHADFDVHAGDQAAALACNAEVLSIARTLDDQPRMVAALRELGRLGIELGDWEAARPQLVESLTIARQLDDRDAIALTLSELGWLALFEEDYTQSGILLAESLAIFQANGDIANASFTLFFLGHLAREQGDFARARARFIESLEMLPLSQYRWALHGLLDGLACLAAAQGQAVRALRLSGAASVRREAIEAAVGRSWEAKYRQWLAPAWQSLGEEASRAARAEGRALTQEQALAYALEELPAT